MITYSKVPGHGISRDPNVSIIEGGLLPKLTRILMAWIVVAFLLVPIPIIYTVDRVAIRMAIVVIFSALLVVAMATFTKSRTVELLLSGAAYVIKNLLWTLILPKLIHQYRYAAVLVVFISGNSSKS